MSARSLCITLPRSFGCMVLLLAVIGCGVATNPIAVATDVPVGSEQTLATAASSPTPLPSPSPTPTPIPVAEGLSFDPYRLPLTIQHVTGTSAVLYFELSAPAQGVVTFQADEPGAGEQVVPFDAGLAAHQVTLDGLAPGVTYHTAVDVATPDGQYQHPGFLNGEWDGVSFKTWADKPSVRFGIVGDSGFGDPVTPKIAARMAAANLDFGLQVGDIVYNIDENKDVFDAFALKYYRPFSPVLREMPMYLVLGNHDDEKAAIWNGAPFYDHAFPAFPDSQFQQTSTEPHDWYAFAYNDVQFLMLDTEAMNNAQARLAQKAWLAERLADKRFATSIPVFHIPPYTGGAHVNDGVAVRADWVPMFRQSGVKLVLSGHDHNYQRLIEDGITYIVSGGGSATLYAKTADIPGSQVFNQVSHFVVFDVYADHIDLQAVALGGDVIDQATIPLK